MSVETQSRVQGNDWRLLNREGCAYGQITRERMVGMKEDVEALKKGMNRITWALVGLMISLATTSITIWIAVF